MAMDPDEEEPTDVVEEGVDDEQSEEEEEEEAENEVQVDAEERDELAMDVVDVQSVRPAQRSRSSDSAVTGNKACSPRTHGYEGAGDADAEAGNEPEDEEEEDDAPDEELVAEEEPLELQAAADETEPGEEEPVESQAAADEADEVEEEEDEDDEGVATEAKRRRHEAFAEFLHLEQRFADLRTEVFYDKMLGLAEEAELLESGQHREFLASQRELEAKLKKRKRIAAAWLGLSLEAYAKQLEMKRNQADCTFEARKAELRAALIADRQAKKFQLMREKRLLDDPPIPSHALHRMTMAKKRRQDKAEVIEMTKLRREYGAFPTPTLSALSEAELEEDLLQLGITSG